MTDDWQQLRARPLERFIADRLEDTDDADDWFERTSLGERPTLGSRLAWRPGRRDSAQPNPTGYPEVELGNEAGKALPRRPAGIGRIPWRRAPLGRIGGSALLCLLAGILALLIDPDLSSALFSAPTPVSAASTRAVAGPLTAFPDWRVAYLAEDGNLYVVTSDGSTTLLGPPLARALPGESNPTRDTALGAPAEAAPNGRWIAYLTRDATLALLNLSASPPNTHFVPIPPDATALYWSPDSARLALATRTGALIIVTVPGAQVSRLTTRLAGGGLTQLGAASVIGWRDPATLLIARRDLGLGAAAIEAISVATDTMQTGMMQTDTAERIALVPLAGALLPRFSLSPARTQLLVFDAPDRDAGRGGAHASVTLIDIATGRLLPLARIAHMLDGPVITATWSPDRPTITALTRVFDSTQPTHPFLQLWTLDVASDTAAPMRSYGIPLGWAPDGGSRIFARVTAEAGLPEAVGQGAAPVFELRSLSVGGRNGRPGLHPIAEGSLRFLGFVRTA